MFEHVKLRHIKWSSALLIRLSCPESDSSAREYAPQGNIRFECEHVLAGFHAQIDDPVSQSYIARNHYERWKTDA